MLCELDLDIVVINYRGQNKFFSIKEINQISKIC